MTEAAASLAADVRGAIRAGLVVIGATVGAFAAWSVLAPLSAAVIAPGFVKSDSNRKSVQHLEGGIVRGIRVRDGDRVAAGQVLLELGSTQITATAAVYGGQLDARQVRAVRLRAERDNVAVLTMPPPLASRAGEPELRALVESEQRAFDSGRALLATQQRLLAAQVAQVDEQILALDSQIAAETRAARLMEEELVANRGLLAKGYVSRPQLLTLERQLENYRAAISEHTAEGHAARQRRHDLELRRQNAVAERRQRAALELANVEAEIDDLLDRAVAARDAVSRLEVRAPLTGTVVDLRVFTVGGVVTPGQPLMDIVPADDDLVIEAMADVRDADDLREGLPVEVRFSGLPSQTVVPLGGTLDYVAADRVADPRSGVPHFVIRARIARGELAKLPVPVKAGMPVEVYVQLGERSALDYLLSPLTQGLRRALREP
jgi:HlyD family type I secretion membrane fusion protein